MPIAKRKHRRMAAIPRVPRVRYDVWSSFRNPKRPRTHVSTRTQKREAIRVARRQARLEWPDRPRQVSVYRVEPGQTRGSLLYQVHYSPKLRRLIAEEL